MKFKVSAILPLPAESYFVERDSAAFRSLVAQMCKLEALEMGDSWMEGETEVYEFVTKPDVERYVPHQFKHFLPGGDLHYTDVIAYDPKQISRSPYRMRVHSVPPIFASKAKIESWLIIEEVTPSTCRQTLEGEVEIRILGLGHLAERIIVDNLKNVYKGVPKIVERWAQFRDEVLKQPGGRDILVQGRPHNTSVDWINDRIRDLIQAPDTESDSASVASTATVDSRPRQLPSVDEMVEQCSLEDSGEDNLSDADEFFDAREYSSWANLNDYLSGTAKQDSSMQKDAHDAKEILTKFTQSGRKLKKVEVDAPLQQPGHRRGELKGVTSQRFSKTYNQDLAEWKDFWEEHKVPEAKHVPDVKNRLGNLFNIGAAMGLFKPGKHHRKHRHRRKHRDAHKHTDSTATGASSAGKSTHSLSSQYTDGSEGAQSSRPPSSAGEKAHRQSHSGSFFQTLFGRKQGRKSEDRGTHSNA